MTFDEHVRPWNQGKDFKVVVRVTNAVRRQNVQNYDDLLCEHLTSQNCTFSQSNLHAVKFSQSPQQNANILQNLMRVGFRRLLLTK